jgi:UTP--glucose-1-phosphate uridylyltransferase
MKIRKAVITAAGKDQRALPLQTLIDCDGEEKAVLHILVEQALAAGVEEVAVVVWPGDESRYAEAAGPGGLCGAATVRGRVSFIAQPEPLGYAHAVHCAREFVARAPFLHLVGDHLCVSAGAEPCAVRLMQIAAAEDCAISAVQATRESLLPRYGTVGGRRVAGRQDLYRVDTVIEKPTPTEAEQRLTAPGLRAGYYLCFFGMHVFTPALMDLLGHMLASASGTVALSTVLNEFARREQYLALESGDRRYDLGARYGLLTAQLALAFNGRDRQQVLADLVELLATRELASGTAH